MFAGYTTYKDLHEMFIDSLDRLKADMNDGYISPDEFRERFDIAIYIHSVLNSCARESGLMGVGWLYENADNQWIFIADNDGRCYQSLFSRMDKRVLLGYFCHVVSEEF